MPKTYTSEGGVFRLLETRYPSGQYALFQQVADKTGANKRYADAIAFGLWPSRGNQIHGFEIKVSRSDWISELNNHGKSADIQAYCHRWWIVAGDRKLVKLEELPPTWGLLIPRGDGLEAKVPAPLLTPKKISRKFCAAVMRRAAESFEKNRKDIYSEMYKKAAVEAERTAVAMARREIERENDGAAVELRTLKSKLKSMEWKLQRFERLEKIIGFNIENWKFRQAIQAAGESGLSASSKQIAASATEIMNSISILENAAARACKISEILKEEEDEQEQGKNV